MNQLFFKFNQNIFLSYNLLKNTRYILTIYIKNFIIKIKKSLHLYNKDINIFFQFNKLICFTTDIKIYKDDQKKINIHYINILISVSYSIITISYQYFL